MSDFERLDNLLKDSGAHKLVFQYDSSRKTYQFEVGLYKSKVWVVSAYGRSTEEAVRHLITRITEKKIIK